MMTADGVLVQRTIDWKPAIYSGLIAGVVYMALEMTLVAFLQGGSPWGPPRMIAAIGMGKEVLPPPATFGFDVMLVAMLIHAALAIIYGVILALIIHRLSMGMAIGAGAVFGLVLYAINFYGFTIVLPWFATARGAIAIFAHVAFGVVAACAYKELQRRRVSRAGM